jgi:hypothetical protein
VIVKAGVEGLTGLSLGDHLAKPECLVQTGQTFRLRKKEFHSHGRLVQFEPVEHGEVSGKRGEFAHGFSYAGRAFNDDRVSAVIDRVLWPHTLHRLEQLADDPPFSVNVEEVEVVDEAGDTEEACLF